PLSPWPLIFSAALVLILAGSMLEAAAYIVLVGHIVLVAGARSYGFFTTFSRKSDLSYGTYIYGWPVQQSLIVLFPGIGVATLLLMSFAIVPLFAFASWHFVEKPALRLKQLDPRWLLRRLRPAG
ncbi:MAG: hypothetical protein ACYCZR_15705, partial [Burkholderiales bacterium]